MVGDGKQLASLLNQTRTLQGMAGEGFRGLQATLIITVTVSRLLETRKFHQIPLI